MAQFVRRSHQEYDVLFDHISQRKFFDDARHEMKNVLPPSVITSMGEAIDRLGIIDWARNSQSWLESMSEFLEQRIPLPHGVLPSDRWSDYVIQILENVAGRRPTSVPKRWMPTDDTDSIQSAVNTASTPDFEESMPLYRVGIYGDTRAIEMLMERIENSIKASGDIPSNYAVKALHEADQIRVVANKVGSKKEVRVDPYDDWMKQMRAGINNVKHVPLGSTGGSVSFPKASQTGLMGSSKGGLPPMGQIDPSAASPKKPSLGDLVDQQIRNSFGVPKHMMPDPNTHNYGNDDGPKGYHSDIAPDTNAAVPKRDWWTASNDTERDWWTASNDTEDTVNDSEN